MTETDGKPRARPCTRYRRRPLRRPLRGTPAGAWNNAVRTRGVFTHRDDFQKLACVERGLVRTARGGQGGLAQKGLTGAGRGKLVTIGRQTSGDRRKQERRGARSGRTRKEAD